MLEKFGGSDHHTALAEATLEDVCSSIMLAEHGWSAVCASSAGRLFCLAHLAGKPSKCVISWLATVDSGSDTGTDFFAVN